MRSGHRGVDRGKTHARKAQTGYCTMSANACVEECVFSGGAEQAKEGTISDSSHKIDRERQERER